MSEPVVREHVDPSFSGKLLYVDWGRKICPLRVVAFPKQGILHCMNGELELNADMNLFIHSVLLSTVDTM